MKTKTHELRTCIENGCTDLSYLKIIKMKKKVKKNHEQTSSLCGPSSSNQNMSKSNTSLPTAKPSLLKVKLENQFVNSTVPSSSTQIEFQEKTKKMKTNHELPPPFYGPSSSHQNVPKSNTSQSTAKQSLASVKLEHSFDNRTEPSSSTQIEFQEKTKKMKTNHDLPPPFYGPSSSHQNVPKSNTSQSTAKQSLASVKLEHSFDNWTEPSSSILSFQEQNKKAAKKSKRITKKIVNNIKLENEFPANSEFNDNSKNSKVSSENLVGKIKLRDPKTLVKPSLFRKYKMIFHVPKTNKYTTRNRTVLLTSNLKIELSLHDITYLFEKYFTKIFQETIVIIANIANVNLLCENEQMLRLNRNCVNDYHKFILVSKLQDNVMSVLSMIDDSDIDHITQILFMCMLNIIAQLHVSPFNFNSTFKNLVQFFSKNLQRSESKFLKFIECIESKAFLSQCNVLIKLVEVAGRHDHFMKNRMAIFFMPKQKINYYQAIINAVIQNLEVDFITLMDEATLNLRNSCKFKDPHAIFLKNAKCAIKNSPILLSTNRNGDQHGTITTSTNTINNSRPTYHKRLIGNSTSETATNTNLEINLGSSISDTTGNASETIGSCTSSTSTHRVKAPEMATTSYSPAQVDNYRNTIPMYPVLRPNNTTVLIKNIQHQPQLNINITNNTYNTNVTRPSNEQPQDLKFFSSCDADNCYNIGTMVCQFCCLTIYCSEECRRRHREFGNHECNIVNNPI
uniref:MYND-type domain-containing protein n=1 Tax=Schizaphis graminum TaxID=13262 RepID=A0A2S2PTN0_SCHGA